MQLSATFILLGFAALANAASDWDMFKEIHGKVYQGDEEVYRKSIFEENLKNIKEHNQMYLSGLKTYSKSANQFADMHLHEILGNGLAHKKIEIEEVYEPGHTDAPDEKDWRKEEGVVAKVKNQGSCGSCWGFSATGSLEGQMKLKKNKTVSLSEQQLVDCAGGKYGNEGCNGGLMGQAFEYIKDVGGIESEDAYPYEGTDGKCRADKTKFAASVTGYKRIPSGDEEALKKAVAEVGPISVAISASLEFQLYFGGILIDILCGNGADSLNHGVLAVGYGNAKDIFGKDRDFWIVKNSWGGSWGESGYIRMARNRNNMCGIATQASYPTV